MPSGRHAARPAWKRIGERLAALRKPPREPSIRVGLTLWLGALSVLPAIGAMMVTVVAFRHIHQHIESRRLVACAGLMAQSIERRAQTTARAASIAAGDPALLAALQDGGLTATERCAESLACECGVDGVALYDSRARLRDRWGPAPAPASAPAWRSDADPQRAAVRLVPDGEGGLWVACGALVPSRDAQGKAGPAGLVVLYDRVDGAFCALQARDTGADVFLYRENGVTLARSGAPLPTAGLQRLIASSNTPIELPIGNHRYLAVSRRLDLPGSAGDVLVGAMASTDQWRNAALRGGWLVLAMLSGVLLLSFGAAAALARRVAEPVVEIAHAAHALAGGDLTRRVRVEGNCELRSLAESFNHMAAELERDTERLRAKNDELDQHVGHVQQLNDLLRKVAQTDSLTQVATHGFVQEQLARELELATATSRPLSVLMIDVDHFKWINDTYGHPAGDQALRELAHVIAGVLRHNDTIGRHGGDEFCVILPGAGAQEAERCAERIRGAAARTEIGEQSRSHLSTTVSVGIATYPDDGTDPASLVAAADQAMYQAKLWRNTALSHAATTEPSVQLLPEGLPSFECPAAQAAAGMAASIDSAGKTAAHHSSSVAACAAAIAAALGLPVEARRLIRLACLVHNIGKVGLPRELLDKTGPLTDDERRVLQTHTDLGGRILRHLGVPEPVPEIVRHHHERFDGKGYPCGLEGKNIPLGSRILAVAEAFALATAPRESGPPISTADALNRLRRESGRAFDPEVTAALGRLRLGASPVPPSSATAEPVGEVA